METESGETYDKEQESEKRGHRFRKPSLLTVGLLLALSMSAYSTLSATGALRQAFPNTQLFSISASYGFNGPTPNSQTITPGSAGTFQLTITSAASSPQIIFLSFVASDPGDWAPPPVHGHALGTFLTMTIAGQQILPENSTIISSYYAGDPGPYPLKATVTVQPGSNTFAGSIAVDVTASLTQFSLSWYASQ